MYLFSLTFIQSIYTDFLTHVWPTHTANKKKTSGNTPNTRIITRHLCMRTGGIIDQGKTKNPEEPVYVGFEYKVQWTNVALVVKSIMPFILEKYQQAEKETNEVIIVL